MSCLGRKWGSFFFIVHEGKDDPVAHLQPTGNNVFLLSPSVNATMLRIFFLCIRFSFWALRTRTMSYFCLWFQGLIRGLEYRRVYVWLWGRIIFWTWTVTQELGLVWDPAFTVNPTCVFRISFPFPLTSPGLPKKTYLGLTASDWAIIVGFWSPEVFHLLRNLYASWITFSYPGSHFIFCPSWVDSVLMSW